MSKIKSNLSQEILEFFFDVIEFIPRPFEAPFSHISRIRNIGHKDYSNSLYYLKRRGFIEEYSQSDQLWLRVTAKGQLRILFDKARLPYSGAWDGKWRLIIFDIPEVARKQRQELRTLLRANNFYKLQASVFISPYPLNREAVSYLRQIDLIHYIRFLRVDEMDFDSELRKHFRLD